MVEMGYRVLSEWRKVVTSTPENSAEFYIVLTKKFVRVSPLLCMEKLE